MGIVVTIALLLASLLHTSSVNNHPAFSRHKSIGLTLVLFIILTGLWNVLCYGSQNYTRFWGQAAILTGLALLLSGIRLSKGLVNDEGVLLQLANRLSSVEPIIRCGLFVGFLLYAITIAQMNLGMEIIR